MRRPLVLAAAALTALAWLAAGRAAAQYPIGRPVGPGVAPPPVYSPYLNLLRRNNSTLQNYYGLVRPELEFRGALWGLEQQVATVGQAVTTPVDPTTGLPLTGHPTQFLNTSHYFLNRGGLGAPPAPVAPAAGLTSPRSGTAPAPVPVRR
jgi:hypothetical protein